MRGDCETRGDGDARAERGEEDAGFRGVGVFELRGDLSVLGDVRKYTRGKLAKTSCRRVKNRSKTL